MSKNDVTENVAIAIITGLLGIFLIAAIYVTITFVMYLLLLVIVPTVTLQQTFALSGLILLIQVMNRLISTKSRG